VFAVARNLARGHGISADGTQWTNGFQPLWALIVAVPYVVFSDDRIALAAIAALSTAIWLTSAYLFARLVRRIIGNLSLPNWLAWAAAILFIADLQLQSVFFNGLETGLYLLCILGLLVWIDDVISPRSLKHAIIVGGALGALIWARNDGIFLAVVLLASGLVVNRTRRALRNAFVAGAAMSIVILPWLAFNMWLNGSPVPQSGAATNAGPYASAFSLAKVAAMAGRLAQATFTPFPLNYARLQQDSSPMAGLLAAAAIAICLLLVARRVSLRPAVRNLWPLAVALVLLGGYYLAGSGAVWMYDRYMIPYKLLSLSVWALVLVTFGTRLRPAVIVGVALAIVGVSLYYQLTTPELGSNMTADVLWLEQSRLAQSSDRIGMFESGRAGYVFAGRVENLDGKVNVAGLRAIEQGTFLQYLESADLDILVFRDYYVPWLDSTYPEWRSAFVPQDSGLDGLLIARRAIG
jgi:hypothetical protein